MPTYIESLDKPEFFKKPEGDKDKKTIARFFSQLVTHPMYWDTYKKANDRSRDYLLENFENIEGVEIPEHHKDALIRARGKDLSEFSRNYNEILQNSEN